MPPSADNSPPSNLATIALPDFSLPELKGKMSIATGEDRVDDALRGEDENARSLRLALRLAGGRADDNQGEAEASNVHEGIGLVIECDTSLRMSSRRPELGKG